MFDAFLTSHHAGLSVSAELLVVIIIILPTSTKPWAWKLSKMLKRLQRLLILCSLCWGSRQHFFLLQGYGQVLNQENWFSGILGDDFLILLYFYKSANVPRVKHSKIKYKKLDDRWFGSSSRNKSSCSSAELNRNNIETEMNPLSSQQKHHTIDDSRRRATIITHFSIMQIVLQPISVIRIILASEMLAYTLLERQEKALQMKARGSRKSLSDIEGHRAWFHEHQTMPEATVSGNPYTMCGKNDIRFISIARQHALTRTARYSISISLSVRCGIVSSNFWKFCIHHTNGSTVYIKNT